MDISRNQSIQYSEISHFGSKNDSDLRNLNTRWCHGLIEDNPVSNCPDFGPLMMYIRCQNLFSTVTFFVVELLTMVDDHLVESAAVQVSTQVFHPNKYHSICGLDCGPPHNTIYLDISLLFF